MLALTVVAIRHTSDAPARSGIGSLPPDAAATRPQVMWLGDSYAEGTGAPNMLESFPYLVAKDEGWQVGQDFAEGGTGYVNDGPQDVTGPRYRVGHFVPAAVGSKPQAIFFAAGINDRVSVEDNHDISPEQLADVALRDWLRARRMSPTTHVIVIGPWWPNGHPTPGISAMNAALRNAARAHGFVYIDPIGEHWITGTRDNPASGNAIRMIGPDGTHPSPAGHRYLARMIERDLARLHIRLSVAQPSSAATADASASGP